MLLEDRVVAHGGGDLGARGNPVVGSGLPRGRDEWDLPRPVRQCIVLVVVERFLKQEYLAAGFGMA